MQYTNEIDEQIARFLAGESSLEEASKLKQWLAQSSDNQLYFNQMQKIWTQSAPAPLSRPLDIEQALARTKYKIKKGTGGARQISMYWIALAAGLALVLGSVWFLGRDTYTPVEAVAALENPVQQLLSDGSSVSVNEYSSLVAQYSTRKRKVKLKGEAYFAVAPNPDRPFVVEVQKVEVTVLGTKFNVDNRSVADQVIVSVDEGKVKVQSLGDETVLQAGDQAIIDLANGKIKIRQTQPTENVTAWASKKFFFEDTPLSEVIPELEKVYQVKIGLSNPALENCRLHVRFEQESIEHIMLVIAETFSLKLRVVNGQYFLEGDACAD